MGSGKAVLGKKTADYNLKPLGQKENAYEVLAILWYARLLLNCWVQRSLRTLEGLSQFQLVVT